jgi:hypothetical protein
VRFITDIVSAANMQVKKRQGKQANIFARGEIRIVQKPARVCKNLLPILCGAASNFSFGGGASCNAVLSISIFFTRTNSAPACQSYAIIKQWKYLSNERTTGGCSEINLFVMSRKKR